MVQDCVTPLGQMDNTGRTPKIHTMIRLKISLVKQRTIQHAHGNRLTTTPTPCLKCATCMIRHEPHYHPFSVTDKKFPISPSCQYLSLALLWQPLCPSIVSIPFSEPPTRLDQLHHIKELFRRHDREAHTRNYPRPEAVHLVRSRQLHRPRTSWGSEQC